MAAAQLSFLPWVRQGAAAAITRADTLGAAQPAVAEIAVTLSINGTPEAPVTVRLRGPADVTGIDAAQVVRMEPRPGSSDFEPNYFAAIEFDRADFPWLFTPASAAAQGRLRPWLCLVVVRPQDGVSVTRGIDSALAVLTIAAPATAAAELPDLRQSWAWAHAQAAAEQASQLGAVLAGAPSLSLSRLLCPRLLAPDTDYIACVVPAFELGRRAGLGLPVGDAELAGPNALAPAWTLTPAAPVQLPVYLQWSFRTGTGGDFESLVRKLRAQPPPAGLGRRPFVIGQPGFALPAGFDPDTQLELEGALQPADLPDAAPAWPEGTQQTFQAALAAIVNTPGRAEQAAADPSADPILAPPLYGRWFAARATVAADGAAWFDALNLDPRHRAVAAFGTQVVQQHQEALMASAWEQAAQLQQANQRVRQLQLSLAVGTSLHSRHFVPLPQQQALALAGPAFARLRIASAPGGASLAARVADSALPARAFGPAMRRITRERGPVARRVALQGSARALHTGVFATLNVATLSSAAPPPAGLATIDALRAAGASAVRRLAEVDEQRIGNMFGRPGFQVVPAGQPVPVSALQARPQSEDTPSARAFRDAAREHLARVNPARPLVSASFAALDLQALAGQAIDALQPRRNLVQLTRALLSTGADAVPPVDTPAAAALGIDVVMAAPKFRQPMYEALRELSGELLLPGLQAVPDDSVIGLKTNRRFVEAYLLGLNVEMARELLWRGFPTDQRGTCFDQFWDTRGAVMPRPDIGAIHLWRERPLADAASAPAREQFVMLMRSALLRRYPNAAIFAVRAVVVDGSRRPSADAADRVLPAFTGSMPPDVSFFGFDLKSSEVAGRDGSPGWYLVIQEHPTEPRFGLDVGSVVPGAGSHIDIDAGVPSGLAVASAPTLRWGQNAAHQAALLRQLPVRIAIHGAQLLAD